MDIRLVRDLKEFCKACDSSNGKFDNAKNEVILKTYKIIEFLSKKVEENKRIIPHYRSRSSSNFNFGSSSFDYSSSSLNSSDSTIFDSSYSNLSSNIYNHD
ncbi:hypothetical protein A9K75_09700 [Campylobacter fetus subsp. testudinum]|nr:hypothetical protein A9K75_09700 [Campylobacter fetus subsp. testudinum]